MSFFCVRLEITPIDQNNNIITDHLVGKIKNDIDFNELISSDKIYKNDDFINFIDSIPKYTFILIPNFYTEEIKEKFDMYGGIYNIIENEKLFEVKILFYKFKYAVLLTKDDIKKFELIFMQAYFIENNILDTRYHNYRLSLFIDKLNNLESL